MEYESYLCISFLIFFSSTITTNPGQVIRSIVTEECTNQSKCDLFSNCIFLAKANEQKRSQDQMEVDEESNIGQSGRGKTELPLQEQEKRMLESSNGNFPSQPYFIDH
jgi:hypothetical protein